MCARHGLRRSHVSVVPALIVPAPMQPGPAHLDLEDKAMLCACCMLCAVACDRVCVPVCVCACSGRMSHKNAPIWWQLAGTTQTRKIRSCLRRSHAQLVLASKTARLRLAPARSTRQWPAPVAARPPALRRCLHLSQPRPAVPRLPSRRRFRWHPRRLRSPLQLFPQRCWAGPSKAGRAALCCAAQSRRRCTAARRLAVPRTSVLVVLTSGRQQACKRPHSSLRRRKWALWALACFESDQNQMLLLLNIHVPCVH
eukprot:SAG22_NODE_797_length_7135_cov_211.841103_4_plen_255_part_00